MASDDPETDPRRHAANIRRMLKEVRTHCRENVKKVDEPTERIGRISLKADGAGTITLRMVEKRAPAMAANQSPSNS